MAKKILIPIPATDFDPTECAVPWSVLKQQGFEIQFATPDGKKATCDQRMIDGKGLGLLAPFLVADPRGQKAYRELEQSREFQNPLSWTAVQSRNFDGIILPGGHAPGMKEYLESATLQKTIAEFFAADKPVGAICHGVVLVTRSKINGVSVLRTRKTTALLKNQEMLAWSLTCLWLGDYYRTYKQSVEDEVIQNLESKDLFQHGPAPVLRDSLDHLERGFTVKDGHYISARWPGDAHKFAVDFAGLFSFIENKN